MSRTPADPVLGAARGGAWAGLVCLVPLCFWLAGHVAFGTSADLQRALPRALHAIWVTQALTIALLAPRWLGRSTRERLASIALLLLVPLPLSCALSLCGATTPAALSKGMLVLCALASGVVGAALALDRVRLSWTRTLLPASLEIAAAVAVWSSRHDWIGWAEQ